MQKLTERHVQAVWYDANLRPSNLQTRSGAPVGVISPGTWNQSAGPDFTNAVLDVGGRRLAGDVEVHICPADWELHGHGADDRYRNVVAHVTWRDGDAPPTLPKNAVSIWIGRCMTAESALQIDPDIYPFAGDPEPKRPCDRVFAKDPASATHVILKAGRQRIQNKAHRLLGRLCAQPERRLQLFYEEVMTAFGYSRNPLPFRHVAERIPLAELPRDMHAAETALQVAGAFEEWSRIGVRPWNSPERRLAMAARLFSQTPLIDFADATDFSPRALRRMQSAITGAGLLGRGRAAAVIANVIAPFAMAEGRLNATLEWLPAEDVSDPVRQMAFRIFGRDHNPQRTYASNGLMIQGLLHARRAFCDKGFPDCLHGHLSS